VLCRLMHSFNNGYQSAHLIRVWHWFS